MFGAFGTLNAQDQTIVSIGTGGVTGGYYSVGGATCRMVNSQRKQHGIRCSADSTGGSAYSLDGIRFGELEFGVVQSDVFYQAFNGLEGFAGQGPSGGLRSVFSLYVEPVTIVARADSEIRHFHDLPGSRINVGNPGSGSLATWEVLERALGWSRDDLNLAAQLKPSETTRAMCDNIIDAYFGLVGHPSALTQETVSTCDARIAEVSGPVVDRLVQDHPYYRQATIPGGMYVGNPNDIPSFGVKAVLVTSIDVSEDVVYVLAKSVLENLGDFKRLHPAFSVLTAEEMVSDALFAPLHPGALRAYRELGLLE